LFLIGLSNFVSLARTISTPTKSAAEHSQVDHSFFFVINLLGALLQIRGKHMKYWVIVIIQAVPQPLLRRSGIVK
jgi:hypothetical protein